MDNKPVGKSRQTVELTKLLRQTSLPINSPEGLAYYIEKNKRSFDERYFAYFEKEFYIPCEFVQWKKHNP